MSQLTLQLLATVGLALSLYFLYVTKRAKSGNYLPLCNISDRVSCTKAATSSSSTLFILPNAFYGALFYLFIIFFSETFPTITFYTSVAAALISAYLIFTLYKMKNFCIICVLAHLTNFLILIYSYILLYQ